MSDRRPPARLLSTLAVRIMVQLLMVSTGWAPAGEEALREFAFGVLAESQMDAAAAGAHFEKAREADPEALAVVRRAVAHRMLARDRGGAVKLLRDLAAARPRDLAVQVEYADFLQMHGGGDSLALKLAEETLERALAELPGEPEIVRRLFQLRLAAGRKEEAVALLDRLSAEDPDAVMLRAVLAKSAFEAENLAEREKTDRGFLAAAAANPEDAVLARKASEHFRESGRLELAVKVLEAHVEAAPSSLEMRARLGVLHLAAENEERGEAVLKEVLEIHPQHALAHQALAKLYRLRAQPQLARHHAGELLKIRGGSAADFIRLAGEATAAGEAREARLLLEKADFDHPENLEVKMKLAMATLNDPETRDDAPRLFREVEAAMPEGAKMEPEFLVASAEALISAGEVAAGEARLREAIRSYPAEAKKETAVALRRLAALWEKEERNLPAARALRQRAEGLDPK